MIDKKRWNELKSGTVQPATEEEKNALVQYREDKRVEHQFWGQQIAERKGWRERKGYALDKTIRGFNKNER